MASNTDFLLALEDVTVSFDGFKAVNALNLYVDKNELRVIIGPNGAGKTTVLDLICGRTKRTHAPIQNKNHGSTRLNNHDIVHRDLHPKLPAPYHPHDHPPFQLHHPF